MNDNKIKYIYLDNASTTKAKSDVVAEFVKYSSELYFNPSALYSPSIEVMKDINNARQKIISLLGGIGGNFIFTSGGTESDNMALFGTKKKNGARIIISATEHSAVFNTVSVLKQKGYDVVVCPCDNVGRVDHLAFKELLNENTTLVSIMYVNNETGAVNDIKTLVQICKNFNDNIVFHSDAVQALGKVKINLANDNVDMMSFSSHKIGGIKGFGGLYIKKGINLNPLIFGGGQEGGYRSGTEGVGGIVAFKKAVEISLKDFQSNYVQTSALNQQVCRSLSGMDGIKIISDENCSPYILLLASATVKGEVLLREMSKYNILIGTGSACSSHSKGMRRIPNAISLNKKYHEGIIRISFSAENTKEEVDNFINKFITSHEELSLYVRK